jgi:F-type H+-transporting ATPase subunit alpha
VVGFESAMQAYVKSNHGDLIDEINRDMAYNDEVVAKLDAAIEDFKKNGSW